MTMLRFSFTSSLANLDRLFGQLHGAKQRALQALGDELAKEIKAGLREAPNGRWGRTGTPKASRPGEAPGIKSGKLRDSIVAQMRGEYLAVGVPRRSEGWYAKMHEYGGADIDDVGNAGGRDVKISRFLQTRLYTRGKNKGKSNEKHSFEAHVRWLAKNRDRKTGESLITNMTFDEKAGTITVTRRAHGAGSNQYRTVLASATRTFRNSRHYPERPFVRPVLARERARILAYFRRTLQTGLAA